jgi:ribonuclease Z
MKIVVLGTGGPLPDPLRHGSAVAVEVGVDTLLFDAGRGVVLQATRAGINLAAINPIFITHHHYDHIGDLADVILSSWLVGRRHELDIYGPDGTSEIISALVERVYAKDIEFRAKGEPRWGGWQPVRVTEIGAGLVRDSGRWRVWAEHVEHGQGLGIENFHWVTLGYRLEAEGKVVAISGDTVPCEGLHRLAHGADLLIQCCYLAAAEITNEHLERLAKYTLATSRDVGKVATRAGVKKLLLTHFRAKSREMMESLAQDVRSDYSGPLVVAEDLTRVEL